MHCSASVCRIEDKNRSVRSGAFRYARARCITPQDFSPHCRLALHFAPAHLEGLENQPVAVSATLSELRSRLAKPMEDHGLDPAEGVRDLVRGTQGGILGSAGGRFFAWGTGGVCRRVSVLNWQTSEADVARAVAAIGLCLTQEMPAYIMMTLEAIQEAIKHLPKEERRKLAGWFEGWKKRRGMRK
jgi:hypothetical protein